MLGYVTEEEALKKGYTHHGLYYGIPIWVAYVDGVFCAETKWYPMEYLMTVFHYIESITNYLMFRDPGYCFLIRPIKEIEN